MCLLEISILENRKNIKDFHGKPIIAYSIETAINSGCFDQVVVSRFTKQSVIREPNYGFVKFGNKFFTFFANILFKGNLSDTMTDSRIITRNAFNELDFDALFSDSTLTMSIRGMKKKQRMTEIIGDQGRRIGGERKMKPFKTGIVLIKRILKEL